MGRRILFDSIATWVVIPLAVGPLLAPMGCGIRSSKFLSSPTPSDVAPRLSTQLIAPNVAIEELSAPPTEFPGSESRRVNILPRDPTRLPTEFQPVTLEEVLMLAISQASIIRDMGGSIVRSPRSVATAYDPLIVDSDPIFGTKGALSQFDPRWFSQITHANNDRVFNNSTIGGGATELTQDLAIGRSGINRRMRAGGLWELSQSATHDANNRVGNLFPNTWEQTIDLSLRQPLMRGAGREFNAIAGPDARPGLTNSHGVRIARLRADISRVEFARRLQEYLVAVEDAYWNLHRAYQKYAAIESSVELAESVHAQTLARFHSEVEGGEADREAESRFVMLRFRQLQQQALVGTSDSPGVYSSEFALRRLIGISLESPNLLRPVTALPEASVAFDMDRALQTAMNSRLELEQQRLRVHEEELKLVAAHNFTRPQLDAISRYRMRGFGDDWFGNGPRFQSAFQDLSSLDHQEWEFGLEMGAPYQQRQAKQAVQFARLSAAKERSILAEQEMAIQFSVQEAILRAASSYQVMILAHAGLQAADHRLKATSALYATDRVPLYQMREAQEAWQQAFDAHEDSKIEYARSIRQVQIESGRYLQEVQVEVID